MARLRDLARRLRRDATPSERRLWALLAQLNREGRSHFRRQAPLGPYIVDFADLSRGIVIEVDGGQHGQEAERTKDERRDDWLAAQGFRVLRFWNSDVDQTPEAVFDIVTEALAATAPHPIPPHEGEGAALFAPLKTDTDGRRKRASLPLVGRERVGGNPHPTGGE